MVSSLPCSVSSLPCFGSSHLHLSLLPCFVSVCILSLSPVCPSSCSRLASRCCLLFPRIKLCLLFLSSFLCLPFPVFSRRCFSVLLCFIWQQELCSCKRRGLLNNVLYSFFLPPAIVKVKTHELREKDKAELLAQLEELKSDLSALRVAKVTGGAVSKLSKIKIVRKAIARTLTVYNQKAKTEARAAVAGKKRISLNLRAKTTRAMRRVLSKEDAARKTPKQLKKEAYFPPRRYAVKA